MALISNGTTIASGGSLSVSTTPTTSQVLSAQASTSAGAVGSYVLGHQTSGTYTTAGHTSNYVLYADCTGNGGNQASGTWRQMGNRPAGNTGQKGTLWIRIS